MFGLCAVGDGAVLEDEGFTRVSSMPPDSLITNYSVGMVREASTLRERKKAKTRAALITVSQQLFADRGYIGTTLEDICAEVDITTQTLLRYFDSKAELALAPLIAPVDAIERDLTSESRSVDTLSVWRDYLRSEAELASHPSETTTITYVANIRAFRDWADKDPALVASASDLGRRLERVLAKGLARDANAESHDLHPTLLAALLVAGRRAVWNRWFRREGGTGSLVDQQLAVVEYAVTHLTRPRVEATV